MRHKTLYLLRNKLLFVLALVLISAFVGTSLINYSLTRKAIHQEIIEKDLPLTRDNIYSDIIAEIMKPVLVASSMATDTFLKEWAEEGEHDVSRIVRYLEQIRQRYQFFTTFFVSEKSGNYYHYKGIHKVISPNDDHDVWYYRFKKDNRDYDLDVDNDEASHNTLTVFINYKVHNQAGRLLGVTGVGVKVDTLAGLISDYQKRYDRLIYLTDRSGTIQVHQDKQLIETQKLSQMAGIAELAPELLALGEKPEDFEFRRNNQQILLTARFIKEIDWVLFVEQNETKALAQARMNLLRTILIGLAVSVLVLVLTLLTTKRYQQKIEEMATRDSLTGVANRRLLQQEFERALYLNSRTGIIFSVMLIDLDGFKAVNDRSGHLAGDLVLKQIAEMIRRTVRPTDIVSRWGGDEFVILTQLTAAESSMVAERIRKNVADNTMIPSTDTDEQLQRISVSCGITEFNPGDSLDSMLGRADKAMYQAKNNGGNTVHISNISTD